MARITATPEVVTQVNYYKPIGLTVNYDSDLPDETSGSIKLKRGWRDTDGDVTTVDFVFVALTPQELATELASVTSGASLYAELQARMYTLCVAHGVIPEEATDLT